VSLKTPIQIYWTCCRES